MKTNIKAMPTMTPGRLCGKKVTTSRNALPFVWRRLISQAQSSDSVIVRVAATTPTTSVFQVAAPMPLSLRTAR